MALYVAGWAVTVVLLSIFDSVVLGGAESELIRQIWNTQNLVLASFLWIMFYLGNRCSK